MDPGSRPAPVVAGSVHLTLVPHGRALDRALTTMADDGGGFARLHCGDAAVCPSLGWSSADGGEALTALQVVERNAGASSCRVLFTVTAGPDGGWTPGRSPWRGTAEPLLMGVWPGGTTALSHAPTVEWVAVPSAQVGTSRVWRSAFASEARHQDVAEPVVDATLQPGGLGVTATAGPAWRPRVTPTSVWPGPLPGAAACFTTDDGQFLLLEASGEWAWDGESWGLNRDPRLPALRGGAAAVHPPSGNLLLVGGVDADGGLFEETALRGPEGWQSVHPVPAPRGRLGHVAAYHPGRQVVVLHGGSAPSDGGTVTLSDTWAWDGTQWVEHAPGAAQPALTGHTAVYVDSLGAVVALGGTPAAGAPVGFPGWAWNGQWSALPATTGPAPAPRTRAAAAYDQRRDRVVLFGGHSLADQPLGDTWEWSPDGGWQAAAAGGPPAGAAALAYDPVHHLTVALAAQPGATRSELWVWNGAQWSDRTMRGALTDHRLFAGGAVEPVSGEFMVTGGVGTSAFHDDAWSWNGWSWRRLGAHPLLARLTPCVTAMPGASGVTVVGGLRMADDSADPLEVLHLDVSDGGFLVSSRVVNPGGPLQRGGLACTWSAPDRLLIHGGYHRQDREQRDSWLLRGSAWQRLADAEVRRHGAASARDDQSGQLVVLGGSDERGQLTSVTVITPDGGAVVVPAPPGFHARQDPVAFHHALSGRTLVGLGQHHTDGGNQPVWDWWAWREGALVPLPPMATANQVGVLGPPATAGNAAAYMPDRERLVVAGGASPFGMVPGHTWELDLARQRTAAVHVELGLGLGVAPSHRVAELTVQARCSGRSVVDDGGVAAEGTRLRVWHQASGAWHSFAPTDLWHPGDGGPAQDLFLVTPRSPEEYLRSTDRRVVFQCRPVGVSHAGTPEASVTMTAAQVTARFQGAP